MKAVFAQNVTVDVESLKVAVLRYIDAVAKDRNVRLPALDEMAVGSRIHLFDATGQPVALDRIVVTFGDS